MKMIRRWTTGLFSRVDWMVSQVENHEALINSALRKARESTARAKVQLSRVRKDGNLLRERIQSEQEAATRWRERAAGIAQEDEKTALECLRRSKRAEQSIKQLQLRLSEHEQVEQQLTKDVRSMEDHLAALIEKRNLMRTRQSRAEAIHSVQGSNDFMSCDLDDIFERWETRVTEKELGAHCGLATDSLEDSFITAEEEALLREELRQLGRPGE